MRRLRDHCSHLLHGWAVVLLRALISIEVSGQCQERNKLQARGGSLAAAAGPNSSHNASQGPVVLVL